MSNAKTLQEWAKEILPIVAAAANGEPVEVMKSGKWADKAEHLGFNRCDVYRIKLKTVRIGKYDVPSPETHPLKNGTVYYVPNLLAVMHPSVQDWCGDNTDINWLAAGLVHRSADNAIRHAEALRSITATK